MPCETATSVRPDGHCPDTALCRNKPSRIQNRAGLNGKLRRLGRDRSGIAAIEFAIIAPVFFFMIFVIGEMAILFTAEQVVENAVSEAARLVRTGQVQKASSPNDEFKNAVCDRVALLIDCESADFFLEVRTYSAFSEVGFSEPLGPDGRFRTEGAYNFGGPNQIVTIRSYYQWPTSPIYDSVSRSTLNGKNLIGSFLAFRNEPYS